MKTCTTCSKQQTLDSFYSDNKCPDGKRAQCKSCVKLTKRAYFDKHRERELGKLKTWKKNNPDKVKAGNLRNLYGITPEQHQSMITKQNNCCAICNRQQVDNVVDKRNNKPRDLAVDHSHQTGLIRGLLCYYCNIAVGQLKDSVQTAERLVEYLKKYEKESTI